MSTRRGLRIRALVLLAMAVLALHAVLLRAAAGSWRVAAPPAQRFVVRTIASAPLVATPITAAPVAAAPAPVPIPLAAEAQRARLQPVAAQAEARPSRPAGRIAAESPARAEAKPQPEPRPASASPAPANAPAANTSRASAAQPLQAPNVPASARLHYDVTAQTRGMTWHAQGELLWKQDGRTYEAELTAHALFLVRRVQRSVGQLTPEGLAPERFSDKVRSEEAAHFERDKGKISFSTNQPDVPLQPGAQDRLSVMMQLSAILGSQPQKFKPGSTITIQTASTHTAEPWIFTVEETEQLRLPGGTVAAIKLTRKPRFEYDQKVELWLATGMDYVPVRLRLTQPNGDWVDQQWSSTDRG